MYLTTNLRRAAVAVLLPVLAALALYSTYATTRASAADSTWGHGDQDTAVVADSTWGVIAPPPVGDQTGRTGQDQNPDTPDDSTWG
ncbi:hypothetical protein [Streptomyces sp. NRRL S-350]|uniref:hypothetical protein n=1 Tax=Streptomyces sp. NRRL S-350 TaxID=1463902 RepID=UPI0004C01418|nr:hypothetical protein [Streptomyces sp. NRRL S-350]